MNAFPLHIRVNVSDISEIVIAAAQVSADPHQLNNLYQSAPSELKEALAAQLEKEWHCSGQVGDNPCNW